MAAVGQSLPEIELSWYAPKTNTLPANTPLDQRKMVYWASQVGGLQNAFETINELERRWLKSLTGVTAFNKDEMWMQAVAGAGLAQQGSIEENKKIYYRGVA